MFSCLFVADAPASCEVSSSSFGRRWGLTPKLQAVVTHGRFLADSIISSHSASCCRLPLKARRYSIERRSSAMSTDRVVEPVRLRLSV